MHIYEKMSLPTNKPRALLPDAPPALVSTPRGPDDVPRLVVETPAPARRVKCTAGHGCCSQADPV